MRGSRGAIGVESKYIRTVVSLREVEETSKKGRKRAKQRNRFIRDSDGTDSSRVESSRVTGRRRVSLMLIASSSALQIDQRQLVSDELLLLLLHQRARSLRHLMMLNNAAGRHLLVCSSKCG